ncbi:unnamed protein product [Chrysoparadoxa australica]
MTVSGPVLPYMARRLLYGYTVVGLNGVERQQEGIPEAWWGLAYGMIMSGYYATKMISAPLLGLVSDKIGRRKALMTTLLGCCLAFITTAVIGQHSIQGLIICRLLMGCFAANGALMMAYIRDTVPKPDQSSAFAQHSAMWGLAYVVATPILRILGEDATRCLILSAGCMLTAATIVGTQFQQIVTQVMATHQLEAPAPGLSCEATLQQQLLRAPFSLSLPQTPKAQSSVKFNGSGQRAEQREEEDSQKKERSHGRKRKALHKLLSVFHTMIQNRLVACVFLLQIIRPAQDVAPLISGKFGAGASIVASISSIRAVLRILVPLVPLIPFLEERSAKLFGGKGDRPVAALMSIVMAVCVVLVPLCPTLGVLYLVSVFKGLASVIKDTTVSAAMSELAEGSNVGAFFGWQHCILGVAGVTSNMNTGWLTGVSASLPYYVTAGVELLWAALFLSE